MKSKMQSAQTHKLAVKAVMKRFEKLDFIVAKTSAVGIDFTADEAKVIVRSSEMLEQPQNIVLEILNNESLLGLIYRQAEVLVFYFWKQKSGYIIPLEDLKTALKGLNTHWKDLLEQTKGSDAIKYIDANQYYIDKGAESISGKFGKLGSEKGQNLLIWVSTLLY